VPILSPPSPSRTSSANSKPNLNLPQAPGRNSFFTHHHPHNDVSNVPLILIFKWQTYNSRRISGSSSDQFQITKVKYRRCYRESCQWESRHGISYLECRLHRNLKFGKDELIRGISEYLALQFSQVYSPQQLFNPSYTSFLATPFELLSEASADSMSTSKSNSTPL